MVLRNASALLGGGVSEEMGSLAALGRYLKGGALPVQRAPPECRAIFPRFSREHAGGYSRVLPPPPKTVHMKWEEFADHVSQGAAAAGEGSLHLQLELAARGSRRYGGASEMICRERGEALL